MRAQWFGDRAPEGGARGRFIDLRPLQDDRRILNNPHKGWFWHYVDGGFSSPNYRRGYETINGDGTLTVLDDLRDFPGLNHLYIRFNWGDIELREGVCDWSPIDRILDAWGPLGYQFAFRPCTFMGSPFPATPLWVRAAGAKTKPFFIDNHWTDEPLYDDPVYLEKLAAFMRAFGARYNGDPRVEYVDVGTFGHWGEANAGFVYPVEAVEKHLQMHVDAFPDTFVAFNDDFITGRMGRELTPGDAQALMDFARDARLVLRDDSICYAPYIDPGNYHSILAPAVYDALYEFGPSTLEMDHERAYETARAADGESAFEDGLRAIAAFERGRATFGGFHGYPREFLDKHGALAKYCANRLGYWYFPEGAFLPVWRAGERADMTLLVTNRGWARAYFPYALRLRLTPLAGGAPRELPLIGADNRDWTPSGAACLENARALSLSVSLAGVRAGEYQMEIGLFDGDRAVHFGVFSDIAQDGYVPLGTQTIAP